MANIKISDTIISNSDKILKKLETYGISYDNFILSSVAGVFNIPYFMIKQENWYRINPSDSDEVKLQKRKAAFAFICDKAFSSIDTNLYNKLSGTESQTYAEWESLVGTKIPKLLAKCIYSELNTRLSSNANPESINSGIATGSSINVSSPTFSMIISVDSIFSNDAKTLIADLQQEFETIFDTTNISPDAYAFKTLLNVAITSLVNKLNGALVSSNQSIDITFLPDRIDFVSKVEGVKFDEESIVFDPGKNVWKVGKVEISNITGLVQALSLKANSNEVVNLTGDQSISGIKNFTDNIKVPDGVSVGDAVNKGQLDQKVSPSDLIDYIKYTNLDTKSFTQIGGLVSLKLRPTSGLVLQNDGLGVDFLKIASIQSGSEQIVSSNWKIDGLNTFRINLPEAIDKFTGQVITPTKDSQLTPKKFVDENFAKKDLVNVSDFAMSKAMVNTLKRSLNFNSGDLNYQSDADGGNIFIKMGQRKPVRSGTITISNKLNNLSTNQIGNRWYANWNEIPELSNSLYEVVLFTSTMPPYVVSNNTDNPGYAVRFDNPAYSNTDSTITLGIGENLTKIEGKLDSPITGYYMRSSNTYQLVQFGMYFELSADKTYLDIYGICSGRDRGVYLNLPADEGPTNFAPNPYNVSYAIYERERRVN